MTELAKPTDLSSRVSKIENVLIIGKDTKKILEYISNLDFNELLCICPIENPNDSIDFTTEASVRKIQHFDIHSDYFYFINYGYKRFDHICVFNPDKLDIQECNRLLNPGGTFKALFEF